jgi:two-component sensor histidine kinase
VQQAFHSLEQSDAIPASEFIEQLCPTLRAGPLAGHNVTSSLEPIRLPNDLVAPVALILNELLINAAKHGCNDADEPIAIEFKRVDGEISLSVRDRGPGFDLAQTRKRSSGLGLVLGLARHIGAKFEVTRQGGTFCVLRLKSATPETRQ